MPRENRKRGKRHKKNTEFDEPVYDESPQIAEDANTGPSWIVQQQDAREEGDAEAPFGYVDADVKAYFRTVDTQMQDWHTSQAEVQEGEDPNEVRRMFFVAALEEMSGKEKQLATDPDCSIILERMIHSMDDFARRVLVDRFMGSYVILSKHRFASHVCQTLFGVSSKTVMREVIQNGASNISSVNGELRVMTQLVADVCEELIASLTELIMDPFASHVIRALLIVLVPSPERDGSSETDVRSKKSATWKARQGPLKSVFAEEKGKGKAPSVRPVPDQFHGLAQRFVHEVRDTWSENEIRSLASNKYASPLLKLWLEVESELELNNFPGSLLDVVSFGLVTSIEQQTDQKPQPCDYVNTLLRDPTSSHLMEAVVTSAPPAVFDLLWSMYFEDHVERLTIHPVANFVIAKAMERLSKDQLATTTQSLSGCWRRIITSGKSGVIRAMVNRAVALRSSEQVISEAMLSAFDISNEVEQTLILQCALRLMTLPEYKAALASESTRPKTREKIKSNGRSWKEAESKDPLEPNVQGALLLQSLLLMSHPSNEIYAKSILQLTGTELINVAHHPISSRVLDAFLQSDTIPHKSKQAFLLSLIGQFHVLVDDRIGSRVGDRCWAFADTYLKEKIARSLFNHEQALAASFYGKFFAKNLNLYLLRRSPDEWKNMQSGKKKTNTPVPTTAPAENHSATDVRESKKVDNDMVKSNTSKKRKAGDDIDALFETALGKKIRKGALNNDVTKSADGSSAMPRPQNQSKDLNDVFNAIRAAPKGEVHERRKRK